MDSALCGRWELVPCGHDTLSMCSKVLSMELKTPRLQSSRTLVLCLCGRLPQACLSAAFKAAIQILKPCGLSGRMPYVLVASRQSGHLSSPLGNCPWAAQT